MSYYDDEPWSWIPHADGADRQKEINAYLTKMLESMPIAKGPMLRWNPTTSRMEPYNASDDQAMSSGDEGGS